MGYSLTLECSVTTVTGITSSVDIVWSSNGLQLQRTEGVNISYVSDSFQIYAAYYNVLQLNTSDNNKEYQCEASVNTNNSVSVSDTVTLDING